MIDWQKVILNIRSTGMKVTMISREIGGDYQHLAKIIQGNVLEPKFDLGCRLLDIHLERCPERHKMEIIGR